MYDVNSQFFLGFIIMNIVQIYYFSVIGFFLSEITFNVYVYF